jgi:hypothetical protein
MKFKQSAVLASLVAGAALNTTESGFLPGMQVGVIIGAPGGSFVGSAIVQTSQDGTTWGAAPGASAVTSGGVNVQTVTLAQFVRLNVTAYTSGGIQASFLSDID